MSKLKPFPKGFSGNPGGQTKAQVAARRLASELASAETRGGAELIEFAARVLRGAEDGCDDGKSKRWACDFLANRLWGKAPLIVESEKPVESVVLPDLNGMSLEELRALAQERKPEDEESPADEPLDGSN